jgi:hypothetical protein
MVAKGGEYFVPANVLFLPLDKETPVALIESPDTKTAADMLRSMIRVWGDGDQFTLRFENLPKLASVFPSVLDRESAVFALCVAGLSPVEAHGKLAAASDGRGVDLPAQDVVLAPDLVAEARKVASETSATVTSLRRYLVKEASTLPDVMTVDAVLSLGFINSENVRVFISRLPYLEKALHYVCKLLLASRIGLGEIPEMATARAARGLDDVIEGLKALTLRKVEESGSGS